MDAVSYGWNTRQVYHVLSDSVFTVPTVLTVRADTRHTTAVKCCQSNDWPNLINQRVAIIIFKADSQQMIAIS